MKTLHAKGSLIINLIYGGLLSVMLILLSVYVFSKEGINIREWVVMLPFILYMILLLLYGAFGVIRTYRTNWIQYGNGKVVVRRVSRIRLNGVARGNWEEREDTFLLEEIDSYGASWQVLGHYVEYAGARFSSEYFFKLKNGRTIGFEPGCYTPRQRKEIFHYIYENTGIEFQKAKNKEEEKKLEKQKYMAIAILLILLVALPIISFNIIFWGKYTQYKKYKYQNEEYYGKKLYSEITHLCSGYESEVGNKIVDKAIEVSKYTGTQELSEKEIGDVGALNRYYYFDSKDAKTQDADFQFITCKITGHEGHVWVETTIMRYDENGKNAGGGGKEMLSLWYIEYQEDEWYVVKVLDTP